MDGSEANIVLHAYFQGGQSVYEDEKKMILSASQTHYGPPAFLQFWNRPLSCQTSQETGKLHDLHYLLK